MKVTKFLSFLILLLGFVLIPNQSVQGHSGRTDSSGGHNCYVGSCAGTYHYHNGGGYSAPSTPNYYSQGLTNGRAHADREASNIKSRSKTAGYQAGYSDGVSGKQESYYPTLPDSICNTTFTFDAGTNETYKSAYNSGWDTQCSSIAGSEYRSNYATGYDAGFAAKPKSNASAGTQSNSNSSDDGGVSGWVWVAVIGGIYGIPIGWAYIKDELDKNKK